MRDFHITMETICTTPLAKDKKAELDFLFERLTSPQRKCPTVFLRHFTNGEYCSMLKVMSREYETFDQTIAERFVRQKIGSSDSGKFEVEVWDGWSGTFPNTYYVEI